VLDPLIRPNVEPFISLVIGTHSKGCPEIGFVPNTELVLVSAIVPPGAVDPE
jgi:hypothetical protein